MFWTTILRYPSIQLVPAPRMLIPAPSPPRPRTLACSSPLPHLLVPALSPAPPRSLTSSSPHSRLLLPAPSPPRTRTLACSSPLSPAHPHSLAC
ncbi:unnamed protein product [Closterium sp. Naga37s-1]|nr:unnamed protein product [Closterium sp. Naga37s-1]